MVRSKRNTEIKLDESAHWSGKNISLLDAASVDWMIYIRFQSALPKGSHIRSAAIYKDSPVTGVLTRARRVTDVGTGADTIRRDALAGGAGLAQVVWVMMTVPEAEPHVGSSVIHNLYHRPKVKVSSAQWVLPANSNLCGAAAHLA